MDVRLPDGTVIRNVPDGTTKAQLTAKLQANGYDVNKLNAPAKPTVAPGSTGVFGALARGTGSALSGIGTALEDVQGADEFGRGMHDYGQKMVEDNPARYNSIKDIKNAGDVLGFGGEKILEMVPQVGAGLGVGTLATVALPETAAGATIAGGLAGLTGAGITFGQQYGETRETQKEKGIDDRGRAALTAGASAALDVGTGIGARVTKGFLRKFGKEIVETAAEEAAAKSAAGAVGKAAKEEAKHSFIKEALKSAGEEGLTEIAQQALQRYGGYQALTGPEALEEYLTSGLGGVLGGGILGGGLGAVQHMQNNIDENDKLKHEANQKEIERQVFEAEQAAQQPVTKKGRKPKAAVAASTAPTLPAGPVQAIVDAKNIPERLKASKEALNELIQNDDRFVGVEVPADIYNVAAAQLAQLGHGSDPFVALSTTMAAAGLPLKGATDVTGVSDTGGLAAGVPDTGTEGAANVGEPNGAGAAGLEPSGESTAGAAVREGAVDSTLGAEAEPEMDEATARELDMIDAKLSDIAVQRAENAYEGEDPETQADYAEQIKALNDRKAELESGLTQAAPIVEPAAPKGPKPRFMVSDDDEVTAETEPVVVKPDPVTLTAAAAPEVTLEAANQEVAATLADKKTPKTKRTQIAKALVETAATTNEPLNTLPVTEKKKVLTQATIQLADGNHGGDANVAINAVLQAKAPKAPKSPAAPKEGPTQAEKNAADKAAKAAQTFSAATSAGTAVPKAPIAPEVTENEEVAAEEAAPRAAYDPEGKIKEALDRYAYEVGNQEGLASLTGAIFGSKGGKGYAQIHDEGGTPILTADQMAKYINDKTDEASAAAFVAATKPKAKAKAEVSAREKRIAERKTPAWTADYDLKTEEDQTLSDMQEELDGYGLNIEVVKLPNNKNFKYGLKHDVGIGKPRQTFSQSRNFTELGNAIDAQVNPTETRPRGRKPTVNKSGPITIISEGTAQGAVKPASGRIAANEKEDVTGIEVPLTQAQREQQSLTRRVDLARLRNRINDSQHAQLIDLIRKVPNDFKFPEVTMQSVRAALVAAQKAVREGKVTAPTRTTEGMVTTRMTNAGQLYERLTRRGFFAGVVGSAISSVVSAATLPRTPINSNAAIKAAINSGSLQTAIEAIRDHSTNPAYKALARILALGGLGDTKLIVEDYGDAELAVAGETSSTSGDVTLYKTSNGLSGDTIETLLHEAIHSYIATRYMALRTYQPENRAKLNTAAKQGDVFVDEFNDLWRTFKKNINMRAFEGDRDLKALLDGETGKIWMVEAMNSPDELLVRSQADPDLQAFLKSIDINGYKVSDPNVKTIWDKIVDMIAKLFGMTIKPEKTALATIMDAGNSLLKAAALDPPNKEFAEAVDKYMAEHEIVREQFERKQKKISATERKIATSERVKDQARGTFTQLFDTHKFEDAKLILDSVWDALSVKTIKLLFTTMTTEDISRWAKDKIDNIATINKHIEDMGVRRFRLAEELAAKIPAFNQYMKESRDKGQSLANAMHFATLEDVDMAAHPHLQQALLKDKKLLELQKKGAPEGQITARKNRIKEGYAYWDKVSPEGREIYKMVRDSYLKTFDEHMRLLIEKIDLSNAGKDKKIRLKKQIMEQFASVRDQGTYFPLMRYGKYWYRVGSGKDGKFFMFDTAEQRNIAMNKEATEYAKENGNRTIRKMIEDGHIDVGDNLGKLREAMLSKSFASQKMKEVFDLLDDLNVAKPNSNPTADQLEAIKKEVDAVKDQVFQMYIMTLPDKDMRRRFTHRTGVAGFSPDVLRNFVTLQHTAVNQLSRLEYSSQIRLAIDQAENELKNNPDKVKLAVFVNEIKQRAMSQISPTNSEDGVIDWDKLSSLGNTGVFLWMLTAPKSGLIQLTQLPIVGTPVLSANYGMVKTVGMMGNYINLINKLTFSKETGPTFRNSTYIEKHKNSDALKYGFEYARERSLFMNTFIHDLTERASKPTDAYNSAANRAFRAVGNAMTASMHHMERMSREIMYMSSFELELNKLTAKGMPLAQAQERAAVKALALTQEALFNFDQYNKPRAFTHPMGKITFQFMNYPLQMNMYLLRNSLDAINFKLKTPEERKMARVKLFGTLGMTFMFAGAVGMPFYSLMAGAVDGLRELMRPGPDDDRAEEYDYNDDGEPLGKLSFDVWFRTWFIPHHFGPESSIAKALNLTDEQAFVLARGAQLGPLSALTDVNMGTSTSLNNLFFVNDNPAPTTKAAFQEMLVKSAFGPLGAMGTQFASALDDFNTGHGDRGIEKILPAFFRGPVVAARLHAEGALTREGAEMKNAEFFTTGKLLMQSLGFNSTEVADIQKANINAKQLLGDITADRARILGAINLATQKYDRSPTPANEAALDKAYKDKDKFNSKYPVHFYQIDNRDIMDSLASRKDRLSRSNQGLIVEKKLQPYANALVGDRPEEE